MSVYERAGQLAQQSDLVNIPRLVSEYYTQHPTDDSLVSFGTSGHRGSSANGSFTEVHIQAICQALVEHRQKLSINGPVFIGIDTHALSECAFITTLQVLVANGISVIVQKGRGYTPTPVISHAILNYNKHCEVQNGLADGIVITPSHNPPQDGGFKYNPPNGGPADTDITSQIQTRANEIIKTGNIEVKEVAFEDAWVSDLVTEYDYIKPYVDDLASVIDMKAIADSGLKIGVDPLGGSGLAYWDVIAETYGINIELVSRTLDPTFSFMTLDKDGKIRMDCSSPYAMAGLIKLKDQFDVAIGNDPDYDRHGIVTRSSGLMNPNHYLAVAIHYLYTPSLNKNLAEVPVGFKWFVDGLFSGEFGFGGEESAGASFLRMDGSVWSTDKDGIILALLAAEITAVSKKDPGEYYQELTEQFNAPVYKRIDAPASTKQKAILKNLSADDVTENVLAGENIIAKLTHAPGNSAAIGGLKVQTENGWFAARPSGTEEIYKIYAESFSGEQHLEKIITEAQKIVGDLFSRAGV